MIDFIASRPSSFDNISQAIVWVYNHGSIKKKESACVSIPPQLVKKDNKWYWKTDLAASEPYWNGWFKDLNNDFLSVPAPKLLILAGTDRLDKNMLIAQMAGKFQLVVMPSCGHQIQEDDPKSTANILLTFLRRNRLLPD
eukprot:TRINITY_DN1137_c0_g1_i1.p1 TRINITY_DN1137_c0_g1~~TRINITY_DN1137_c0_g1_i1.p1  ORF type:complete len:140 (+),score=26.12 TRINITY_DN1137_c0_g1_i1:145-564(+)